MRIAVTGGRDFGDRELVRMAFGDLSVGPGDTIVNGGCRGADLICAEVATELGASTEEHPADWLRYGRSAGPIRNRKMLSSGVGVLVAFPGGNGTNNCVMTARSMGIRVIDERGSA